MTVIVTRAGKGSGLTNAEIDSNFTNLDGADAAVQAAAAADATAKANAAKAYADGLVVGLWDDRGNYDASVNTFPATGGSGTAGAVLKGDIWSISVAGALGGVPVSVRQTVRAMVDAPAQAAANWAIGLANTDLDDAISDGVTGRAPSQNAVFDALALKVNLTTLATAAGAGTVGNTPAGGITEATVQGALNGIDSRKSDKLLATLSLFSKADTNTVAFTKTAAATVSLKAGSYIDVAGTLLTFAAATAVTMPALTAGEDYAIYACADGSVRADANFSAPTGYTSANSRKIGGFHYSPGGHPGTNPAARTGTTATSLLITALSSTSDLTVGMGVGGIGIAFNSKISSIDSASQITLTVATTASATGVSISFGAGNATVQINEYSLWDLKFKPACTDPRGMALVADGFWADIYLLGVDHLTNGSSKYNVTIADGASPPKVPAKFGGNGTTAYTSLNWWEAGEVMSHHGKRLPNYTEFAALAFGTTEASSIGADPGSTTWAAAYISKWGCAQVSGNLWQWGANFGGGAAAAGWVVNTVGRGSTYQLENAVTFSGDWTGSGIAGSRCGGFNNAPAFSFGVVGARGVCGHLVLE